MNNFETRLRKYAELTIRMGLNLQPGQHLLIWRNNLDTAPMVRAVAEAAYKAGAHWVNVFWHDEEVILSRYKYAPRDSFDEFPQWLADGMLAHAKGGGAFMAVVGDNPDLLRGQDEDLMARSQKARSAAFKPVLEYVSSDRVNWLVVGAATPAWAQKVFPELSHADALEALWEALFTFCRVDAPDPNLAWQKHIHELTARAQHMNKKRYAALRFRGPGTDLTVGLPDKHLWKGAGANTSSGIAFIPNMPTEEIFTMPHRERTEGVVKASMPLSYQGALIEDFSLEFEAGRVTSVSAQNGETVLRKLVESDDGAARLGEVALVPHSSPIAQMGRLFYSTLYDENAASHIALGRAYPGTLEGGNAMSRDELRAAGANNSIIHVDFMIGSAAMDVDGILPNGSVEAVMREGEWVFKVHS
ncbi:MAG: aminopeptidase [Chloroflexi bacterium]|nr:aminopeptidase [Chloroflexota bacterium]